MTLENTIRTAYAKHLILNFGSDAFAMFHEMPHFKAFETVDGIAVVVDPAHEGLLSKAVEVFASQIGFPVFLNGLKFTPPRLSRVA